jgi:hypothetical protein
LFHGSLAPCHSSMVGHLPAGGNQLPLESITSQVSSFGSPCRPAARCQPLRHFIIVPKDFTLASSVGTS